MKKIKDYLLELSLVIIGILIAFAIENWARQRQERESLQAYVNQIQTDLAKDVQELSETVEADSVLREKLRLLAKRADDHAYSGIDTLAPTLVLYNSFRLANTGYSMLVNSPQSSLVPIELYVKITQYYVESSNFYNEQFQLDMDFSKNSIAPLYLESYKQLEKKSSESTFNKVSFSGYVRGRLILHSQVWRARKSLLKKAEELQKILKGSSALR